MELVADNPFRVLGLPATATSREISKRVSDLETFAELGKAKKYDTDLALIGRVERTVSAVKAAAQKIEQAESKLFHSFFWFRAGHENDAAAISALVQGDPSLALDTWNDELSKAGKKRYSSRLNRAVLQLWLATHGGKFDRRIFAEALEDIGFVVDEHLDESVGDVLGANAAGLNREALWKRVVDSLVAIAQSIPGQPYGTNAMSLVSDCWTFPPTAVDYIRSKVTNPVLERVEATVAANEKRRADATEAVDLDASVEFKATEMLLVELRLVLGEDDPGFQAAANRFAEELCASAIAACNKFDDAALASKLIDWSVRLPSFGRIASRIAENKQTLDENLEHSRNKVHFDPILEAMDSLPGTIPQTMARLTTLQSLLAKAKAAAGASSVGYIEASSACANHVLNALIAISNAPASGTNIENVKYVMNQTAVQIRKLQAMDLNQQTRERLAENLETAVGVERKVDAVIAANKSAAQNKVIGWVIFLAIILGIAFFK